MNLREFGFRQIYSQVYSEFAPKNYYTKDYLFSFLLYLK